MDVFLDGDVEKTHRLTAKSIKTPNKIKLGKSWINTIIIFM